MAPPLGTALRIVAALTFAAVLMASRSGTADLAGELAQCKALLDAGLPGAARTRLEPLIEAHPQWARALGLMGMSYVHERRYQLALTWFERALAADPEELAVRPLYGVALFELGRQEEARTLFESVLERRPSFAPAHLWLGRIALEQNQPGVAQAHLQKTIDLATTAGDRALEADARVRIAELLTQQDRLADARRELEPAVALDPTNREAWFRLAGILARLGDAEAARSARQHAEALRQGEP